MADRISSFKRPPRATDHCRHYSFERGQKWIDSGPRCAVGVDLKEPGQSRQCMPAGTGVCVKREEFTCAEREAWQQSVAEGTARLIAAIAALPAAIPLRTSGKVECPNCLGDLHFARWHRGAEMACATPGCCSAHFSIAAGADWPAHKDNTNG